ncbi:ABC transporter ATP-binding protein [Aquamicrobium sp. LC103]|uniref:ABC transporter ATP-binding protein n=1 Tax=Aquamicrobium sp. LC103 TaxID=1120658 RepID=UPI000B0B2118|nr:ABC transporter ATP-binding protein [Aquamicrobium sp. LC103]
MTRRYGQTVALDNVSLNFPSGSFTSLLGPSGCGKTTMLRLIAGFEAPERGSVVFDGDTVADASRQMPPEKRGIGIVFQSYALWPHMDVAGNVAYPLATRGVAGKERDARVREVLSIVGLDGYQHRRIDELSGGQRQRVALARCLIANSRIILFDEPLANLDMHLRASMVEVFRDIHRRTGATMVYVTHDQAEALALSDRIAVMDGGRILQTAPPTDVYRSPACDKVAGFVGRGAILDGEIIGEHRGMAVVEIAGHRFEARCSGTPRNSVARILLRPEGLRLAETGMPARVVSSVYRGPVFEVVLALAGTQHDVVIDCVEAPAVGTDVRIAVCDAWVIPG